MSKNNIDTTVDDIKKVFKDLANDANSEKIQNPYRYLGLRS